MIPLDFIHLLMSSFIDLESFREVAIEIFKTFENKLIQASNTDIVVTSPPKLKFFVQQFFNERKKIHYKPLATITNPESAYTLIVITNSDPENLDLISTKLQNCSNLRKALLVIPKLTENDRQIIEKHNLQIVSQPSQFHSSEVFVGELPADFIPVEQDFFLMPSSNSFKKLFLFHETNEIYNSARALTKIQYIYGRIPHIVSVGDKSEKIQRLMSGMLDQCEVQKPETNTISSIIIFDRLADLITPLSLAQPVDQLYYDYFDFRYGLLQRTIDNSIFPLNDNDTVYKDYRHKSLFKGLEFISNLKNQERKSSEETKSENTIASYFKRNNDIFNRLLVEVDHNIYESSCDTFNLMFKHLGDPLLFSERLVSFYGDWRTALRFLCIISLFGYKKGLTKSFSSIQKEVLAEYGSKALEGLLNLELLKLISSETFGWDFESIVKELDLFSKELDTELKIATYGYKPVSAGIAEFVATNKVSEIQPLFSDNIPQIKINVSGQPPDLDKDEKQRILVFFTGGVTFTEVAYLKDLAHNKFEDKVQFIIGATESIGGNELIEDICPFLKN